MPSLQHPPSYWYGIELGIVIYFELDIGSGSQLAVFIHNGDRCFGRRGIIVDHVDLGVTVGYVHDFFRSVVFAEYFVCISIPRKPVR